MTTFGVDLSNHNGGINIEQIAAEGYRFAICKASQGTYFRDGWFDGWIPRIRNAGMVPGAYHWLEAGAGAEQARILHGRLSDHGGPSGFLVACDNEADADWATTQAFVAEWEQVSGGHPLLMYTGGWWWRPRGWDGASLTPYLWHSSYVNGSGYGADLYGRVSDSIWAPGYGGWPSATILQFSSSASVAGMTVDVDAFRGSVDELRSLTGNCTEMDADMQLDEMFEMTRFYPDGLEKERESHTVGDVLSMAAQAAYVAMGKSTAAANRLDALAAKIDRLEVGGVDVDALAAKVADLLAERLKA